MNPRLVASLLLTTFAACGGGSDVPTGYTDGGPGGATGTGEPTAAFTVYAHTSNDLYTIDPDSLEAELIGTFTFDRNRGQVTDLAIDREGRMIAITFDDVFYVDAGTAACRWLASLDAEYNGLTFVPAGQIAGEPAEILIGTTVQGGVTRVDVLTGTSSAIGNYGGGLTSSGDIVSVIGLGTLATVRGGAGPGDSLAAVDPTTGLATPIGGTGELELWGLAFWDSNLFGFSSRGRFYRIDPATGASDEVTVGFPQEWWGAAVTTSAPVTL